ncbi:hypothetical protein [Luteolibacter soli]|uniref:DUF2783 domain-containing protein n=1 Tax=Luteolibacter soli TaxID=3135280 RepID=A0ABU9B351_9BACT
MRVRSAVDALDVFQKVLGMGEDCEEAIPDLITNLLHLAHSRGVGPKAVLRECLMHFVAEAGELPPDET